MIVALTGATGFVGKQILRELLDRGCNVRAIVRDPEKLIEESKSCLLDIVQTSDLFEEHLDRLVQIISGAEILIHAAWYTEPGKYLTSVRNIDCLKGTLNLARAFADGGGKRLIGIGSCAEYDLSVGEVSIDTPLKPNTLYATCKVAAYWIFKQLAMDRNINYAWCRLFYLFGQGEDKRRLIPYLHTQLAAGEEVLLTHGEQVRDFLDVKEAARMIANLALSDRQGVANICSGKGVTIRQIASSIADQYGRRDLLRFGARPENPYDPPHVVGLK